MRPIAFLMAVLAPLSIFGQARRVQVQNAATVVEFIEQSVSKYKSFAGSFVYRKNNKTSQGSIIYAAPDKMVMDFAGNLRIVSDGKFVWISDGSLIGRQSLEAANTSPVALWNLRRLSGQYTATAAPEGLEIMYGNTPAYQIIFEPKANTTGFRRIELIAERDSGLIRQIKGTSRVGNRTELAVSYREFNKTYNETNFIVETTEDSQIYDNVFN